MKTIFWNIDTQYDFMYPDGKLYIEGAENIIPILSNITEYAHTHNITIVDTGDFHPKNDLEFSDTPNYKTTFPEHCVMFTPGARFIPATDTSILFCIIRWDEPFKEEKSIATCCKGIKLYKNKFDIFEGNPYTERLLNILKPDKICVYGVASNVCVDFAVTGLLKRNYKVTVITNAIKELPGTNIEKLYKKWTSQGAELLDWISTKNGVQQ